jgi:hypothetical protein
MWGFGINTVSHLPWIILPVFLVSCTQSGAGKKVDSDKEESSTEPVFGGGSGADEEGEEDVNTDHYMTIRSEVMVELYTTNDEGVREFFPWDDAVGIGGEFPFGSIFVAAYLPGTDGREFYFDQHTVTRPRVGGDFYRLEIDPERTAAVNIYASLDVRGDGIVGSEEPMGVHPNEVPIEAYGAFDSGDIVILVDWDKWGPGGWGWQDVGGYVPPGDDYYDANGDGVITPDELPEGGCDRISVSGDIHITSDYHGGNGMVMLLDESGGGPHQTVEFVPVPTATGAVSSYDLGMCENSGFMQIVAAYDLNGNGLVDPADKWGAYVSEPGVDGNPIFVEDDWMTDIHIEIPLGDGSPSMSVVPFVHLSGQLVMPGIEAIADLVVEGVDPAVYVAAMKYRPEGEVSVEDFEESYDYRAWGPDALGVIAGVEWDLVVPANTVVYLWAFVDADGDGLVNESDEPVASGGVDGAGTLSTGEEGHTGIHLGPRTDE